MQKQILSYLILLSALQLPAADMPRKTTGEKLYEEVSSEIKEQIPVELKVGLSEVTVELGRTYAQRKSGPVKLDIYRKEVTDTEKSPRPAIVVIHGGSWKSGDRRQLGLYAASLARRGYIAFAIDYRLAPKHPWPAQWEDVRDSVIWIRSHAEQLGVDPERIGAVGYSAGGHLASMLAVQGSSYTSPEDPKITAQVNCVAAGGAPCDFTKVPENNSFLKYWLGKTRGEAPTVYTQASPLKLVSAAASPVFFYNGVQDFLVRPNTAFELSNALKKLGIDTAQHLVPGAGHFTAALDVKALNLAWAFLDKYLKPELQGSSGESQDSNGSRTAPQ